jgi:hypothetical protein
VCNERWLIAWWGMEHRFYPLPRPRRWRFECVIRPRRELTPPGFLLVGLHVEFWIDWWRFGLKLYRVRSRA